MHISRGKSKLTGNNLLALFYVIYTIPATVGPNCKIDITFFI